MSVIHLALEEGFHDDRVVIRLNGKEFLEKAGVSTRHQIGFAERVDIPFEGDDAVIEVLLPERGIQGSHVVNVAESVEVGAFVREGKIAFHVPTGYA